MVLSHSDGDGIWFFSRCLFTVQQEVRCASLVKSQSKLLQLRLLTFASSWIRSYRNVPSDHELWVFSQSPMPPKHLNFHSLNVILLLLTEETESLLPGGLEHPVFFGGFFVCLFSEEFIFR